MSLKSSYQQELIEAGCDEAGRGCLAGPVFAAALIFPNDYKNSYINDSKKLTEKERSSLRIIIEREALCFQVTKVEPSEIDRVNILQASFQAMHLAIKELNIKPELLLVDGNRFLPFDSTPHVCVIRGDSLYLSIAAASILAKTYRDAYMEQLHEQYPQYNWAKNKGYPTIEHRKAIALHGPTVHHRKSFKVRPV